MRRIVLVSLLLILCLAIAGAKTCTSDSTKMSNAMLNTKTHLDESKDQNIGVDVLESKNTINFEAKKTNVKTWHVDDDKKEYPNAEYANIQDAINAASDGDVIIVYAGRYSPFVVNKSLNITGISVIKNKVLFTPKIVGKSGEKIEIAKDNCIISGFLTNTSINVNSSNNLIANNIIVGKNTSINVYKRNNTIVDNVFIENFVSIRLRSDENLIKLNTIRNSDYGIGIKNANKNLIFSNEFINNNVSISLLNSNSNEIARNIVFHSNVIGIHLNSCSKNIVAENIFANCTGWALRVFEGNENLIAGNRFENNTATIVNKVAAGFNIFIMNSTSNTILSNIIKGVIPNTVGIFAFNTLNTQIESMQISSNIYGIYLWKCNNISINNSYIAFNGNGTRIDDSKKIRIQNSLFKNNDWATSIKSSNVSIANNVYVLNINTINVYSSNSAKIERNIINANSYGIVLENSNSCNIENNRISNITHYALKLIKSNENFVRNNTIVDNEQGIFISGDKNTLTRNVVGLKNGIGNYILFITSKSNLIYLNDFSSSRVSTMGGNRFYSPDKIKYEYEGKTFTNYLGNYWGVKESLLTLLDYNKDGIIDMEKKVGMDIDKYQLAKSFKKYRILG